MVSVNARIEEDSLVIEPEGKVSKFASLKRRMEIPLSSIRSVSTEKVKDIKGTRIGGTAIPPHFAGHFYDFTNGRIFYALSDREKCVTIETDGFTYQKVVVQVEDKEQTAGMIRQAIAG